MTRWALVLGCLAALALPARADWDGDGKPDQVGIKKKGSGGRTELHVLSGASDFKEFILHKETALAATDADWDLRLADWDGDGRLDLVGIKKKGESGKTELHVLSAVSDFQKFILQKETALEATDANWDLRLADWDADGRMDLVGINKKGARGKTEVHVLSGASDFRKFILHKETALATDDDWDVRLTDWDGDGRLDLAGIKKKGDGGRTEVHVLSGASDFQKFILHKATALHATDADWQFQILNWDDDDQLDLVGIKKKGDSGTTELHVLSGASEYQKFVHQKPTALHQTDGDWECWIANTARKRVVFEAQADPGKAQVRLKAMSSNKPKGKPDR